MTYPTGIAWETFHTLGSIPVYGRQRGMLRTEGKERRADPSIRLLRVVAPSLQPAIRLAQSADLAAATALRKGAGLPTDDQTSAPDLPLSGLGRVHDQICSGLVGVPNG
jgi:hypothetical protein